MVFDSEILNLPFEWVDGLGNRWLRVLFTILLMVAWVIPLILVFITPLLIWNAFNGD